MRTKRRSSWRAVVLLAIAIFCGPAGKMHRAEACELCASPWVFAPAGDSAALVQDEPAGNQPSPQRRRLRRLGPPPDWAYESWFMRRSIDTPWVLRDVNVIDVETGGIAMDVDIAIRGDVIVDIGPGLDVDGADVVDGEGGWVIPGLFDLHAHVIPKTSFFAASDDPEITLRTLLDAGVTTIRLLPFYTESAIHWSSQVQRGEWAGPTIIPTSSIFEKSPQRTARGFENPETARAWVRREALAGARWIKVYNAMDEACLAAIVETAEEHGMKVCGHANQVPPHRASALGIGTVEHASSLAFSALPEDVDPPAVTFGLAEGSWCWRHADLKKLDDLMAAFRENGTGWVPTFVVLETLVENEQHDRMAMPAEVIDGFRIALREAVPLAVEQHRAGGLVGLGTDFPVNGVEPGVSAHRELEILVEGGATPLEALQIATVSSAKILGHDALLGRVEPGMIASLVVLKENPLEDISRVRSIRMVVHDGRRHEPDAEPRATAARTAEGDSVLRLHRGSETREDAFTLPATGQNDRPIYLEARPALELRHIRGATIQEKPNGRASIRLTLTDAGREALAAATADHEGLIMAVIWRGKIIAAPFVRSRLASPHIELTAGTSLLPDEELASIAEAINQHLDDDS